MTQAVINNLNNLQDVLALNEAKLQPVNKQVGSLEKTDFNKIFDNKKQVAQSSVETEDKSQLSEENSTIANFKTKSSDDTDKTTLVDLKDVISAAMEELKVEKSLDLTLAKDVTEIINQLKEFIESATEEGEIIVDETMLENLAAILNSTDFQNMFSQLEDTSDGEEIKALFAQISEILNAKSSQEYGLVNNLESIKTQIDSIFEQTEQVEIDLTTEVTVEKYAKHQNENVQNELESDLEEDLLKELNIESIESETASSDGESLMQNQTPEEQGLKAMLNQEVEAFDLKVSKAMNTQNSSPVQAKVVDVNPSKILDQVAKQLEGLQSGSKVNIVLNPEALGRVTVQLIKTGEGLSAQFTVASPEVRDMLMKGLDGLKETLLSQGVGVDNVSVKLSEAQKSEYNADWTEQEGSNGGNKEQGRSNREEKEKGLFEKMMAQTTQDENGNV